MLSRDLQRILKIRDYCLGIQDTIARFGNSPDGFLLDSDYQQSIAFSILQIGELVKRLSDDFLQEYTYIPWSLIAKTRDNYAHHYGTVDFEMVWTTAVDDLPAVEAFCRKYLEENAPEE